MESFGASQSSGVRRTSGRTRSHHQWFGPPSPRIFGAIRSGRKFEWPELRQVASPRPRKWWAPQSCLLLPRAHTSRAKSCSSTEHAPSLDEDRPGIQNLQNDMAAMSTGLEVGVIGGSVRDVVEKDVEASRSEP